MDEVTLRKELCILLCHHLRDKLPSIYDRLCSYCESNKLIPVGCKSVEEALSQQYSTFSDDHFLAFINSLRPDDDFPSIFRKISPFRKQVEPLNIFSIKPYSRATVHKEPIYCMCTDPGSRILATGSDDRQIKIWALPDLKPVHVFSGHEGVITNIAINPLCTLLISSSHDKTVRIWSLKTGQCISVLGGFTSDVIHYCAISPTGSMIAAGCEDGSVQLWSTSDAIQGNPPTHEFKSPGRGAVRWITFSPGGEFMCYSSEPNSIVVVTLKTMNEVHLPSEHSSVCDFISFSSHLYSNRGEHGPILLAVSNEDGFCDTWMLESLQWKRQHFFKRTIGAGKKASKISTVAISCDENIIVVARTSSIFVHQTMTGEIIGHIAECAACTGCVAIAPHPTISRIFFIANKTGEVAIIDAYTCKIVCQTSLSIDPTLIDAVWSQDGRWIYATDAFGAITTFTINGQMLPEAQFNKEIFEISDTSHDGTRVFADSNGNILPEQPECIDIRDMDLGFQMLQGPILQASAAEVRIIKRIVSGERLPQQITEAVSAVAAPSQHITSTIELPFNPHGQQPQPPVLPESADITNQDDNVEAVDIVSDQDDWCFDAKEKNEGEEMNEFLMPVISKDIMQDTWPLFCTITAIDDEIYIPQVGDEAFFFREAYEGDLSQDSDFIDFEFARCIVSDIGPISTLNNEMNITLTFPSYNNNSKTLKIQYPSPSCIIPITRYKQSLIHERNIKIGSNAVIVTHINDFNFKFVNCTVVSIENNNTHLNNITVDANGEKLQVSPWNFVSIDGNKIKFTDTDSKVTNASIYISRNISAHSAEENYHILASISQTDEFGTVSVPMTLSMIYDRLNNGFYRTIAAIQKDISLLSNCADTCLSGNEAMYAGAKALIKDITKAVDKSMKTNNFQLI